jgi:hypothetical protein
LTPCQMCHGNGWVLEGAVDDETPGDDRVPIDLALIPCLLPDCRFSGRKITTLDVKAANFNTTNVLGRGDA